MCYFLILDEIAIGFALIDIHKVEVEYFESVNYFMKYGLLVPSTLVHLFTPAITPTQ